MKRIWSYTGVLWVFLSLLFLQSCSESGKVSTAGTESVAQTRTGSITAQAIVFVSMPEGEYVTRQEFSIHPGHSLRIVSKEPTGSYTWGMSGGSSYKAAGTSTQPWTQMYNQAELLGILHSFSIAGGFISPKAGDEPPVRIQGLWRQPMRPVAGGTVTPYLDIASGKVDMVVVSRKSDGSKYAARAYNERFVEGLARPVPTRIDVYEMFDTRVNNQVMNIDFVSLAAR